MPVSDQNPTIQGASDGTEIGNASDGLKVNLRDSSGNELTSYDLDNTGGTAKVLGVSIRTLTDGTPAEFGNSTNPFRIDPTGLTAQPITDNGGSLTIDGVITANAGTGNYDNSSIGTNNSTLPTSSTLIGGQNTTNIIPIAASSTTPTNNLNGLIVRPIPFEPATFSLFAENINLANNKSMFAIQNAIGSSIIIKIQSIKIINSRTTATTGVIADFHLKRISSFSGGTSITPQSFDTNDSLNASVTASTNSTVSGESASSLMHVKWSSDEWGTGTTDVESYDHAIQAIIPFYQVGTKEKPIVLRAGQGLTLKNIINTTAGTFDFIVIFTQE